MFLEGISSEYYIILLPLALILIFSKIFMKICKKLNLPSVIGMIVAGLLIGLISYIPNQDILNETTQEGLGFLSKIGAILILFSAGLETDLKQIKSVGGPAVIITIAGVIVPMGLGFLVATLCNGGFANLTHDALLTNLFYGTILTATSVGITVQTLREMGKLNSRVGSTIVAAAIIDDVLGIIVLSFVLALKGNGGEAVNPWIVVLKTIGYFAVIAVLSFVASKAFKWLDNRFEHHRLVPIFSLAFCFIIAYLSEKYFGIADITGAYIVGLILSTNNESGYIERKTDILSYMLFVPVFFANIGISTKFESISGSFILFGCLFIVAGIVGKLIGCGIAAKCCKYSFSDSVKIGVGMMARAEVCLVTASKGAGIIDNNIMPFIVLLIIITSLLSPIFLKLIYNHDKKKEEKLQLKEAGSNPDLNTQNN